MEAARRVPAAACQSPCRVAHGLSAFLLATVTFSSAIAELVEWRGEGPGEPVHFAHYNILASSAGHNGEPWFLLPLNLSAEERGVITARFYEKDEAGRYVHNLADGFGGLLTREQIELVKAHNKDFEWGARYPKLVQKVWDFSADIVSLVEMDHFPEFRDALGSVYDAAFARRPRRSSSDGSSLFWRRSRFALIGDPVNVTFEDWEPRPGDVHHEDRVMLAVALRDKLDGRILVAASVHLMRNPEDTGKDPMRMLEVSQMMRGLSCFVAKVGASGLVVMGDFNAVPQSWTHVFMLHGWQDCPDAEKHMRDTFESVEWGPDNVCTTKTMARSLWIDYIFFSSRTMDLVGPPMFEPCPSGPIPDANHPSDHLPVQATLRFLPAAGPLSQTAARHQDALDVIELNATTLSSCFVPTQGTLEPLEAGTCASHW